MPEVARPDREIDRHHRAAEAEGGRARERVACRMGSKRGCRDAVTTTVAQRGVAARIGDLIQGLGAMRWCDDAFGVDEERLGAFI